MMDSHSTVIHSMNLTKNIPSAGSLGMEVSNTELSPLGAHFSLGV